MERLNKAISSKKKLNSLAFGGVIPCGYPKINVDKYLYKVRNIT